MSLFKREDPDLQSLIAYLVARSRERQVTLTQTKLVKLLYLIDVERYASGRASLSGLRWVFFHYGPYALELPETIEPMRDSERLIAEGFKDSLLYRAAPGAPDGEEWPPATRRQVDEVIRRYAALELNELLDHVYFHTAPMRDAKRGQELDMTLARSAPPRRPQPALEAPSVPTDAAERLERWREQRTRELVRVQAAEQGAFFSDPEDEHLALEGTHGRLVVSDEAQ
jgi:hypothetical protein